MCRGIRDQAKWFGDRLMLVGGQAIPVVYATPAVFSEAMEAKCQGTGDARHLVPREHALVAEDLVGFGRRKVSKRYTPSSDQDNTWRTCNHITTQGRERHMRDETLRRREFPPPTRRSDIPLSCATCGHLGASATFGSEGGHVLVSLAEQRSPSGGGDPHVPHST